jgi:drug/metabolite transporter (DMT)-like permease
MNILPTSESHKQLLPYHPRYVAPLILLLAGLSLAISTNLAKVALGIGFTSLSYLVWSLAGASFLLTTMSYLRGQSIQLNRQTLEYFIVSGFLTTAASNLIFFSAVRHMGVGFVALMMALPPLLTYVGALLLRIEQFCWWRAMGVSLALIGIVVLVMQKWISPNADPAWILITLTGPILLAIGNLYRTHRWPLGASAGSLAPGMLLSALTILIIFSLLPGKNLNIPNEAPHAMSLIGIQAIIFAAQFLLLFTLQKLGGPVLLSLMGGVSAIFGVPIAVILLDEAIAPVFLVSALFVVAGIICMLHGSKACQGHTTLAAEYRG